MIEPLEKLVDALSRLPTIGRKSAWRLALHMIDRPQEELTELAQRIGSIKSLVRTCSVCFNYSTGPTCPICASASRDQSLVCVVEKPTDVIAIERAGRYHGVYHVLGGLLSPIRGITPDRLHIGELKERVEKAPPRELILGLGGSSEAETTGYYIARILSHLPVRVTRFARGVPAGMELEYVDQITLSQALQERTDMTYTP